MKHHRQFRSVATEHPFYDRKIRKEGGTRILSLGKVLPEKWEYVRIQVMRLEGKVMTLRIEKLYGGQEDAQTTQLSKACQQNT